jgi:dTDP-4-amino-4,6-dideoxygalactose transaminase
MNDISAVIGIEQMDYVDDLVKKHISNAEFYDDNLKNLEKISLIPRSSDSLSASWLYTLHVEERDAFMKYMSENNVMTSKVHERNDKHDCFADSVCDLPGVDSFCSSQISIPVGWWLTHEQRQYIVDLIKSY